MLVAPQSGSTTTSDFEDMECTKVGSSYDVYCREVSHVGKHLGFIRGTMIASLRKSKRC